MIDTMGYGIAQMTKSQMGRYLPLPDYTGSTNTRVRLEVHGRPIDERYSQMLLERSDLDIDTVILLDRVQKRLEITDDALNKLRRGALVEGRRPNIHVSRGVAEATGTSEDVNRLKGASIADMAESVRAFLTENDGATRPEIDSRLAPLLPAHLDHKQRISRISNLLTKMKQDGVVTVSGRGPGSVWRNA